MNIYGTYADAIAQAIDAPTDSYAVRTAGNALDRAERALTALIKEATEARNALFTAADLAGTDEGSRALGQALMIANNPGASGTLSALSNDAFTNLAIAHTAIQTAAHN